MLTTLAVLFFAGPLFAADKPTKKTELKSLKERASYSIGLNMGTSMKKAAVDLDIEVLAQGLRDGLSGNKPQLAEDEINKVMTDFQKELENKLKAVGEKNKKDGQAFLAANKKKDGVKTTKSGLQYKVIKAGTGQKPKAEDMVTTNYRGTFIDGTEFDSSKKHGKPVQFGVDQVIPGWTEALQLMPVGSKWQLFIPAELAYGEQPPSTDISPNSTLIFELELVSIDKPEALPGASNKPNLKGRLVIPDDEK
jgi:FKBP-type peptidyl-prolyl cis-trans isomerase FklB